MRIRCLLFLGSFIGIHSLFGGQIKQDEMRQAESYFEAEDYLEARNLYESLLSERIDPWEKRILEYNIATSFLAEGKWETAMAGFEALSEEAISFPLLNQKLLSNLALVYVLQLDAILDVLKKNPSASNEEYHQSYLLFAKIFLAIDKATVAWCTLESVEGSPICPLSENLQELRSQVKMRDNEFSKEYLKYRLAHASIQETLSSILITSYRFALIREPLQEDSLAHLLETQVSLEEIIKKLPDSSILENYEKAQKYLKLSLAVLKNLETVKARFFAEIAQFYIKLIVEKLDSIEKEPKKVLENVIANQRLILFLNQLKKQISSSDKDREEMDRLTQELQALIVKAANDFIPAVLIQQKKSFTDPTKKDRCQCHPWDEVIPLFSKGYDNAQLAEQYLEHSKIQPLAIERLQKLAVIYWKEALAKLDSTSASPKKTSREQDSSKQKNQQKESSEEPAPSLNKGEDQKFNETLRLIQEMEHEDQSKPQRLTTPTGEKGRVNKPW